MLEETQATLRKRGRALQERKPQLFATLSKEFRKSKQPDRKHRVLEALDKDLDLRDRWLGIRELKT